MMKKDLISLTGFHSQHNKLESDHRDLTRQFWNP